MENLHFINDFEKLLAEYEQRADSDFKELCPKWFMVLHKLKFFKKSLNM